MIVNSILAAVFAVCRLSQHCNEYLVHILRTGTVTFTISRAPLALVAAWTPLCRIHLPEIALCLSLRVWPGMVIVYRS